MRKKRRCFCDGRGRKYKKDILVSLTLSLGAIPAQKAYKLFRLREHHCLLIYCPVGQMFSLHGGKERMQRFQLSRVTKCEPTWQQARPIPTSLLLQVLCPSSEHIQARKTAKAFRTIFCSSTKRSTDLMLKVESVFRTDWSFYFSIRIAEHFNSTDFDSKLVYHKVFEVPPSLSSMCTFNITNLVMLFNNE